MSEQRFVEIDQTIEYNGKTLVCVKQDECAGCYFGTLDKSCCYTCDYLCSGAIREDGKSVIYKLYDKKTFISEKKDVKIEKIKQIEREIDLINHELKVLFHDLDDSDGKEEDSIIFDLDILQDRQLLQDFKLQQAHWRKNTSSHRN